MGNDESSDRDLLELAAKAAGIFITKEQFEKECTSPWDPSREPFYNEDKDAVIGWRTWYGEEGEIGGWEPFEWAPHTDDGESRRLEVDLNIEVRFHLAGAVPAVTATCASDSRIPIMREPWGEDKRAATRLAVLRAAAEIGKAMP